MNANRDINFKTSNEEIERIVKNEIEIPNMARFINVGKYGTCLYNSYAKYADAIENFEVRDSDIMVVSYPKSGTTWTQELVWQVLNDLDFKNGEEPLETRVPFLEMCTIVDWEKFGKTSEHPEHVKNSLKFLSRLKGQRIIKTHLPVCLLPYQIRDRSKSPKIIHVFRNPKDVCVSFFHHGHLLLGWTASLENFAKVFLADKVYYGPFWKHVLEYWDNRDKLDILHIKYEDMITDLPAVINKVAAFLNKTLTDDQVTKLTVHLSFKSMKNNNAVNLSSTLKHRANCNLVNNKNGAFIRSGKIGKYIEELSKETIELFDAWIKKNLDGTDFGQVYDFSL